MELDPNETLSGFEAVWQRVTGAVRPPESPAAPGADRSEASILVRFIEDSIPCVRLYTRLAGHCGGSARGTLLRLASEDRRRLRRLQMELFLLDGDDHAPHPSPEQPRGMLSALRSAYVTETELSHAYRTAAAHTQLDHLRELYLRFALEEKQHADALRRLIGRAMG